MPFVSIFERDFHSPDPSECSQRLQKITDQRRFEIIPILEFGGQQSMLRATNYTVFIAVITSLSVNKIVLGHLPSYSTGSTIYFPFVWTLFTFVFCRSNFRTQMKSRTCSDPLIDLVCGDKR